MSYTILLDSSSTSLTVGLAKDEVALESISYECWQTQSEHMVPEINNLLEKYNCDRRLIDSVVVSIGPASYTGVRVSLTIAKIIALALNAKVYPVSSLRVLQKFGSDSICVINARSNRSYVGVYKEGKILLNDCIMTNSDLLKYIDEHPNYVLCGDTKYLGIEGYKSDISYNMIKLMPFIEYLDDAKGLKPVYMKD